MQVWRADVMEGRRPEVISARNLLIAFAIHFAVFIGFYVFALLHGLFEPKETIIPIDLTVIVNENLDGVENEPPPLVNPPPPAPPKPPKPKPVKPKIDPPKALEQIVTNVVVKVDKKEEEKKRKEEEKRKKEEAKKKAEEKKKAEDERLKKMRERAVKNDKPVKIEVKNAKESGNGKTQKQNMSKAEIEKLLNQGYKPGPSNQIAHSEVDRCIRVIKMALKDKWKELKPRIGNEGVVTLSFELNSNGGLINVRVIKSSGDLQSDAAAKLVASRLTRIRGLSSEFISHCRKEPCVINYTVEKE